MAVFCSNALLVFILFVKDSGSWHLHTPGRCLYVPWLVLLISLFYLPFRHLSPVPS
jgi:hypothetical protein